MSNCTSGLGLGLIKLDLNNREEVISELIGILSVDLDLAENEEMFRVDTLELGYESEAERIVDEETKGKEFTTGEEFKYIFEEVFGWISNDSYFCVCSYEILDLGDGIIVLAYAYGGNYDE